MESTVRAWNYDGLIDEVAARLRFTRLMKKSAEARGADLDVEDYAARRGRLFAVGRYLGTRIDRILRSKP